MRNKLRMTNIEISFVCAVVAISGFGGYPRLVDSHEEHRGKQQPHIIVIMADDLGWNDVGFHGSDQIPTPNIDALAYNGVILNRHYTLPICTPSRSAFYTGRYPIRDGMQGYPLKAGEPRGIPLDRPLLPNHLRGLGYETHLVGKWHVGYYTKNHIPTGRGFDTYVGHYSGYLQYFAHTIQQETHIGLDLHRDKKNSSDAEYNNDYLTDFYTAEAERIITSRDPSKSLYLQVTHNAVHNSDKVDDPLEVRDLKTVNDTLGYIEDFERRKFAGMVTALDESVGRIVAALNRSGILENSVILFLSDNGADNTGITMNHGSNYPLRGEKFLTYEGGVRGVACIYSPLITNNSRILNDFVHITDWLPTFYGLAGGDTKNLGEIDGVDQWRVIDRSDIGKAKKRDRLLINIDEVKNVETAIIGSLKFVKGENASDFFGQINTGDTSANPKYNASSVLSSWVNDAIATSGRGNLTYSKIEQLRESSRVECKEHSKIDIVDCLPYCLFDIIEDPCETRNLSEAGPEVVEQFKQMIEGYRGVLLNQTNQPVDPASFPENFDGVWMPWIDDNTCIKVTHE